MDIIFQDPSHTIRRWLKYFCRLPDHYHIPREQQQEEESAVIIGALKQMEISLVSLSLILQIQVKQMRAWVAHAAMLSVASGNNRVWLLPQPVLDKILSGIKIEKKDTGEFYSKGYPKCRVVAEMLCNTTSNKDSQANSYVPAYKES